MKIAVLGTGAVGESLATKLVELGHTIAMGSRTPDNPRAAAWARRLGVNASHGTFTDVTTLSEMILLCTKGEVSLEVIRTVGAAAFGEKVVVDVCNPLDFSRGLPPALMICNTDSLGEQVQKALPQAKVVKALNTVNCEVMVDPAKAGHPTMFMAGNDGDAKTLVLAMLRDFGWTDIADLGDIKAARGMEMMLPLWLSVWTRLGHPHFGLKLVQG